MIPSNGNGHNAEVFKDDETVIEESLEEKKRIYIDTMSKRLKNDLDHPDIEICGYAMFILIILFVDFLSYSSDMLLSGFISIMIIFFLVILSIQHKVEIKVYLIISVLNGYLLCFIGIYNRYNLLQGLKEDSYSIREIWLIKRSIGGDIFTLTTYMLIFALEMIIASLYGILRKNLNMCEEYLNV